MSSASAQAPEDVGDSAFVEIHAFVSQGFILTLRNEYLVQDSTSGSTEFSEAGINFTKNLTELLRVGIQFFAQNVGRRGNFDAQLDWFHVDYRWRDWLGLRAGRLKIPYGLYNEIQDADSTRVPVLLPQSVYPLQTREILFAQSGAELYGYVPVGAFGALDYRLFGGTIFLDADSLTPAGAPIEVDLHVPYVAGGRLIWETPVENLRLGASLQFVRIETTAFFQGTTFVVDNDSLLWVASAEYLVGDWVLTSEYSRWYADQDSTAPALSPPIEVESERAYVMATWRQSKWFQPGVYYSLFFPNVDERIGRDAKTHDLALTLRFDLNSYWLVKLEGHYLSGTAALVDPLVISVGGAPSGERQWGAFFVKTTGYF